MNTQIRIALSRAKRVADYATAHPITDGGFAAIVTRLVAAYARGEELGIQQSNGAIDERAAVNRRRDLRLAIATRLRRLVGIAALAARSQPELTGQFVMPDPHAAYRPFLLAARALVAAVDPVKDILTPLGLGDTFVTELTQLIDEFDTVTSAAHAGRSDHVGARGELNAVARSCNHDVRLLDTYYQAAYAGDADALMAWDSASNLPGPFHHQAPPAPAPQPAAKAA